MYHPVTEDELNAYADGHLDPGRRVAVEAYLQSHPEAAADLMQDVRLRGEIRRWLDQPIPSPGTATAALARRFGRVLRLRQSWLWLQRGSAVAGLILVGWLAHGLITPGGDVGRPDNPEAVLADDADQAWHVAQLTQPEAGSAGETGRAPPAGDDPGRPPTDPLPNGMRRVGSDQIPWDGGKAWVELIATPGGEQLVLLKAATEVLDSDRPSIQVQEEVTTVAWRDDGYAYALSGDVPARELLGLAHLLAGRS